MKFPPINKSIEFWRKVRWTYSYYWVDDDYDYMYYRPTINKQALIYVSELEEGEASFLKSDIFDMDTIVDWIRDTIEAAKKEAQENYNRLEIDFVDVNETDIIARFPSLYDYEFMVEELNMYYSEKYMNYFEEQILRGNSEFTELAGKLEWKDMVEKIPFVKDIFLF